MNYPRLHSLLLFIILSSLTLFAQVEYSRDNYSDFTFAQIADIQITDDKPENLQILKDVVADISTQSDIAFLLVTGNITENGDSKSFKSAKTILDQLLIPYYITPGNSDLNNSKSSGVVFRKLFKDNRFRIQFNGLIFLGVNSASLFSESTGHVAPHDLIWLKRQLKNVGKKIPIFIYTSNMMSQGSIDNWFDLSDVIRTHNIQFIAGASNSNLALTNCDAIPAIQTNSLSDSRSYTIYDVVEDTILINNKPIGAEKVSWQSLPVERKVYVEGNQKDFPRPNYSINSDYRQIEQVWNRKLGVSILTAPSVNDNNLYFGDITGKLHCYSLNKGKSVWSFQSRNRIVADPVVIDNTVIFGSCDKTLYALDATTGKTVWRARTNNYITKNPIVIEDRVYIELSEGSYQPYDLKNGEELSVVNEIPHTLHHKSNLSVSNDGLITIYDKNEKVELKHKVSHSIISVPVQISETDWVLTTIDGNIIRISKK